MILVPEYLWEYLLDAFRWPRAPVERVAYLDGIHTPAVSVTTTLTIPDAQLEPLRYNVSAAAMSEAGAHFRAHGLCRLAQVHTHPSDWVGHSPVDDERAYSQHTGALSIVLPFHAQDRPTLESAGVLRREQNGWHRLETHEIASVIRIIPSILDFRRS